MNGSSLGSLAGPVSIKGRQREIRGDAPHPSALRTVASSSLAPSRSRLALPLDPPAPDAEHDVGGPDRQQEPHGAGRAR